MRSHNIERTEYEVVKGQYDFGLWFFASTFSLGLFALWSREVYVVPIVMGMGYIGVIVAFRYSVIISKDLFNPLCLAFFIAFVRYNCHGLLLMVGVVPPPEMSEFYRLMGLSEPDWLWAHVLTLTSMAGIALGWFLVRQQPSRHSPISFSFAPGISHAAVVGMLVGFAGLIVFIVINAGLGAILTGAIRSTTIQKGTGVFFRLMYMMIVGSILLSAYLLAKNKPRMAILPSLLCGLFLLPLGGRGRAIMPLFACLLLYWYSKREEKGWPKFRLRIAHVLALVLSVVLGTWLFYFGVMYRGGHGIGALTESLSLEGNWKYIKYSVFADFGHLHSLAGAIAIGPGVLQGATFFGSLSWPLTEVLSIPARSAGIYIVETLVGFPQERWGLHASLIGDAYLNFGLFGIMLIMPLFGMLSKLLYAKFRAGRLNVAIYAFAAVYGTGIFLKSIETWPHILTGLVFMWVIIRLADFLKFSQPGLSEAYATEIGRFRAVRNR